MMPSPRNIAVSAIVATLLVVASCGQAQLSTPPATTLPAPVEPGADSAIPVHEGLSGIEAARENASDTTESTIRIPLHDWSSQLASAEIVGRVLEEAGFSVEYVPFDSQAVYQAMCDGEIDFVHEVWQPAFGAAFEEQLDKGCVLDWATHDAITREEWWYPDYVEEQCPGLPDWEALNDCASLFATEETGTKGRYLAGLADWEYFDAERIESLGMDFEVVHVTSSANLWTELEAASADRTPIVLLNWTPNFVEAVYEGKFVEFPAFEDACHTDPGWGINRDLAYDCGGPSAGYLKIGVSSQFPGKWPGAAFILKRINFTNAILADLAAAVDTRGKDPVDAAQDWMAANEDIWRDWLPG